jgi:hypothetical protein
MKATLLEAFGKRSRWFRVYAPSVTCRIWRDGKSESREGLLRKHNRCMPIIDPFVHRLNIVTRTAAYLTHKRDASARSVVELLELRSSHGAAADSGAVRAHECIVQDHLVHEGVEIRIVARHDESVHGDVPAASDFPVVAQAGTGAIRRAAAAPRPIGRMAASIRLDSLVPWLRATLRFHNRRQ